MHLFPFIFVAQWLLFPNPFLGNNLILTQLADHTTTFLKMAVQTHLIQNTVIANFLRHQDYTYI